LLDVLDINEDDYVDPPCNDYDIIATMSGGGDQPVLFLPSSLGYIYPVVSPTLSSCITYY